MYNLKELLLLLGEFISKMIKMNICYNSMILANFDVFGPLVAVYSTDFA